MSEFDSLNSLNFASVQNSTNPALKNKKAENNFFMYSDTTEKQTAENRSLVKEVTQEDYEEHKKDSLLNIFEGYSAVFRNRSMQHSIF